MRGCTHLGIVKEEEENDEAGARVLYKQARDDETNSDPAGCYRLGMLEKEDEILSAKILFRKGL